MFLKQCMLRAAQAATLFASLPALVYAKAEIVKPANAYLVAADEATPDTSTNPTVTVDFGSRTNHAHPIPPDLFYTERSTSLHSSSDLALLKAAGITGDRDYALLWVTYNTQTPDWNRIDASMRFLQTEKIHPMLQIAYTPPWLQPNPNPCGAGQHEVAPTNINEWAKLAASYVAHMDATFPGVVRDYEIWNEPNVEAMCGTPASQRLSKYLQIYAAAAKAMKEQAAADHATIRVGGPATAGYQPTWISALTTNPATAPYVDFVSYHQYIGTNQDINAKWDTVYQGLTPWYTLTQGSSGAAAWYRDAETLMLKSKTPLGAKTPVYITEFNLDWAFEKDCCRNDPTYSPIWNTLYVTDVLDTVYSGATQVPSNLVYFASSAWPYFCLIGDNLNSTDPTLVRNCRYPYGSTPQLYPQYFAYQLMGSSNYLGLQTGGYMAASISPQAPVKGLAATAFYNSAQDSLLLINPTSTNYANVTITLSNTGYQAATAKLYRIVTGNSISTSTLTLQKASGTTYTTTINVPAYSVQGIAVK